MRQERLFQIARAWETRTLTPDNILHVSTDPPFVQDIVIEVEQRSMEKTPYKHTSSYMCYRQ